VLPLADRHQERIAGRQVIVGDMSGQPVIDHRAWFTRLPDQAGWTNTRRSTEFDDGRRFHKEAESNLRVS
jgi:hypothetical protein